MKLHRVKGASLIEGDCVAALKVFAANRFDSVVTDPPYELGFMGHGWDKAGIAFDPKFWAEVLRVMKPGAHLLAFGGTRTYHRMTCAIEDAGFEIRDSLHWFYGTGFPKSLNLGEGRGTALKPGHEPIALARKPIEGTVAENFERWGTGAINVDVCRLPTTDDRARKASGGKGLNALGHSKTYDSDSHPGGRWPANVLLDDHAAAELDAQTSELRQGGRLKGGEGRERAVVSPLTLGPRDPWEPYGDSGGASRFFYVAKPGRAERDLGCDHLPERSGGEATGREDDSAGVKNPRAGAGRGGGARNFHPTVKPIELLRYLIRLIAPPGGTVLDPFVGSGTTGIAAQLEQRQFLGIEREPQYIEIAKARLGAEVQP